MYRSTDCEKDTLRSKNEKIRRKVRRVVNMFAVENDGFK